MPPSPAKTQFLTEKSFVFWSTIETFSLTSSWPKSVSVPAGQQPHFFDSRLTYHASRSAMVGAMGAGYPLSQNWGYNNYSSYLGYNSGTATLPGYTQPAISSYPSVIDPILPSTTSAPTSPPGELLFQLVIYWPAFVLSWNKDSFWTNSSKAAWLNWAKQLSNIWALSHLLFVAKYESNFLFCNYPLKLCVDCCIWQIPNSDQ